MIKPPLWFLLCVCLTAVFTLPRVEQAQAQDSLRIAAVVNDEIISAFDLNSRIRLIILLSNLPNVQKTYNSLAPATLRALIDEKIKLQEAENLGISASQNEIDNAVERVEKRNKLAPGALIGLLQKNGVDLETLFNQLRTDIIWSRIVARKHRKAVSVSDEEVDALLAEDEAARNQPRYRISEIVIPVENPEALKDATDQVRNLVSQLQAGAEFSALARSFSQSPSAPRGGEVGWLRAEQIPVEVRSIVIALQPGQISQPTRITSGYIIFKMHEIRSGAEVAKPDAVLKLSQLHLPLPADAPQDTVTSYLETAHKRGTSSQGCEAFEETASEIGSPLSGSLGEVNLSKLPPAIKEAVASLPAGRASEPIRTNDAVIVFMVCERKDLPVLDNRLTRAEAENRLLSSKLAIYARQEIRKLRRAAYIEVR